MDVNSKAIGHNNAGEAVRVEQFLWIQKLAKRPNDASVSLACLVIAPAAPQTEIMHKSLRCWRSRPLPLSGEQARWTCSTQGHDSLSTSLLMSNKSTTISVTTGRHRPYSNCSETTTVARPSMEASISPLSNAIPNGRASCLTCSYNASPGLKRPIAQPFLFGASGCTS